MLRVVALLICLTTPLWAETAVPQSQAQIQLSFAPVVEISAPSVVNIYATRVVANRQSPFRADPFFSQFFERGRPRLENSLGSGVIVDPSGIVVSNNHVVGDAAEIRVALSDRREYGGVVLLSDPEADIAVIQITGAEDLPAIDFGDSDRVAVGDLILAIGNPFGVGQTVTSGIISGLARSGADRSQTGYYIQTDAPINPGNSGGALIDMAGRLVGINTSILTRSGGSNGIGFAIPANLVRQYVRQAAEGRSHFARPWTGVEVQEVDHALGQAIGQTVPAGVMITELHAASPLAGALGRGDVILSIDGLPVNAPTELEFRLSTAGLGAEVALGYLAGGRQETLALALAEAPDVPPTDVTKIVSATLFAGLIAGNANPRLIAENGLPLTTEGVIVLALEGISRRTGLRPGDAILAVNGQPVGQVADLVALTRARQPRWEIELRRDGRRVRLRLQG